MPFLPNKPLLQHDAEVWRSFANDRLWVCRIALVNSLVNVVSKIVGVLLSSSVKFDVHHAVVTAVVFAVGLYSPKVRDNILIVCSFGLIWTIVNVISTIAILRFVTNDGHSFMYPLGANEGEDKALTTPALRMETVPFVAVLTLAAMGVPSKLNLSIGAVLFLCEIITAAVFTVYVDYTDPTDVINIVSNHMYSALLTLYFAWAVEVHHIKASDSLILLKHTLRQWMHQKDEDRTTRNRIVGYIFHEVRNPLNNILLAVDVLNDKLQARQTSSPTKQNTQQDEEDNAEISELVGTITTAADSACHVLNDALSLQKLESGTFEFVKQPFSLDKFQTQAVRVAAPMMRQKHITLNSHIDASLERVNVFGDFNRLQQVLNNFLSNAYKFTPNHGTISVRMTKEGESFGKDGDQVLTVRISVQDSGAGIPEVEQSRVFLPWSQIRASDLQQGQGSGLGLSLCKAFVETGHDGRIGFTSQPEKGSIFFFEIDFKLCDDNLEVLHQPLTTHNPQNTASGTFSPNDRSSTDASTPHRYHLNQKRHATPTRNSMARATGTGTGSSGTMPKRTQRNSQTLAMVIYPRGNTVESTADPVPSDPEPSAHSAITNTNTNTTNTNTNTNTSTKATTPTTAAPAPTLPMVTPAVPFPETTTTATTTAGQSTNTNVPSSPLQIPVFPTQDSSGAESTTRQNTTGTDEAFTADVLIVDDSLVTRKLLSKILDVLVVSYETCENGQEAVDRVLSDRCMFRLIIMDKEMPVMDGFNATRALRAAHYDSPIVGLTGNAMDDQVAEFLAAGVNNVFSKPIKRDGLLRVLTQYNIRTKAESQVVAVSPRPIPNLARNDLPPNHPHSQQLELQNMNKNRNSDSDNNHPGNDGVERSTVAKTAPNPVNHGVDSNTAHLNGTSVPVFSPRQTTDNNNCVSERRCVSNATYSETPSSPLDYARDEPFTSRSHRHVQEV